MLELLTLNNRDVRNLDILGNLETGNILNVDEEGNLYIPNDKWTYITNTSEYVFQSVDRLNHRQKRVFQIVQNTIESVKIHIDKLVALASNSNKLELNQLIDIESKLWNRAQKIADILIIIKYRLEGELKQSFDHRLISSISSKAEELRIDLLHQSQRFEQSEVDEWVQSIHD